MDVARLNFSHGTDAERATVVESVRRESEEAGRPVGVLADLSGPKVRLGPFATGEAEVEAGARFVLRPGGGPGDPSGAATTHPGLAGDLRPGDTLFLADGAVELRVDACRDDEVVTEVVRGGAVPSGAGVNVPAGRLSVPAITEKDGRDLARALELGADFVAQSFVRRAEDLAELRALADPRIQLVAKIETRAAVEDADRIMREADVLMLARGDLGVEIPFEEVPIVQKDLTRRAIDAGVPIIIATQMLESMTSAPRPTRAEASDVANAVVDGADAILLSAETAIGRHPVEAARAAIRICRVAERGSAAQAKGSDVRDPEPEPQRIARAAALLSRDGEVAAIACFTRTGRTAGLVSALRPTVPVIAFSPEPSVVRRLTMQRAVIPRACELPHDTDEMMEMMVGRLREEDLVPAGVLVVLVASTPVGAAHTNLLKVHRVGADAR